MRKQQQKSGWRRKRKPTYSTIRKPHLTATASVLVLAGTLAACTEQWNVEAVRALPSADQPYLQALKDEYLALAEAERTEQDWRDTAHFVDRARRVSLGEDPGPEALSARDIDAESAAPLQAAREQLVGYLDAGARDSTPAAAAAAVGAFDCWMQEQEEGHQPEDIAACRADFESAMDILAKKPKRKTVFVLLPDEDGVVGEVLVNQNGKQVVLNEAYESVAANPNQGGLEDTFIADNTMVNENFDAAIRAHPLAPREFTVFFDFASTAINDAANIVVAAITTDLADRQAAEILIRGHADRAGTTEFNQSLSAARAQQVFKVLKNSLTNKNGKVVDVRVESLGETVPMVKTPDGVPEPKNRRVEVLIR